MKKSHLLTLISLLIILGITACNQSVSTNQNQDSNGTNTQPTNTPVVEEQIIKSDDGKIQVTVPKNWTKQNDLNDKADLQVANLREENYLIVLSENKADFNMKLEDYAKETLDFIKNGITVSSVSEGKPLQVNGKSAIEYEIRGTIDGINIVYLHTTVETETYFHQIIAWTLPSKFDVNQPILQSAINSFQEN